MADSGGQVSSKTSEKSKYSNSVTRTTSETLRLNEADKPVSQPNTLSTTSTGNPRKKTSFQITSVTVVGSRTSNDGGDDSADDLDESHTDDISEAIDVSRDIENETPSYSEDTFSKDDVFFNASASLGTAPVIPTSSQYGLAILATPDNCETALHPSDGCGSGASGGELHMGVNDNVINLGVVSTKPDPEMRDIHTHQARHERFKVVKIESTEPFKRGRWVCMDYLDHSISQPKPNAGKPDVNLSKPVETVGKAVEPSEHSPQNYSTTESVVSTAETVTVGTPATEDSLLSSEQMANSIPVGLPQMDGSQQLPITNPQNLPQTYGTSVSPGQSLQGGVQTVSTGMNTTTQVPQQAQSLSQVPVQQQVVNNSNQHQSLQPQQIQQVLANANVNVVPVQQQQTGLQSQPQLVQQTMQQMQPVQQQQQQQQQQFQQQQFQPMQQQQPQQQPVMQQQMPQQPMQQQMQQVHMQNVGMQQQQQPQGQSLSQPMQQMAQQPTQLHQVSFSQPMQAQATAQSQVQGIMQQMHPQQMQGFQQNQMMSNQGMMSVQPQPQMQQQYYTNVQPMQQQAQMMPPMSQGSGMPQVSIHGSSGHIGMQSFPVGQQMMPQTPPVATSVPSYPLQFPPTHLSTPSGQPPPPGMMQQQQQQQQGGGGGGYASTGLSYVQQSVVDPGPCAPLPPQVDAGPADAPQAQTALLDSLVEVTNPADDPPQGEESESASGASAVAIDNKIEQAMDLVKSHLMFAVREEVEVLKEKIAELMDRINQLEVENSILRASATQETLSQLPPPPNSSQQQQPANPP